MARVGMAMAMERNIAGAQVIDLGEKALVRSHSVPDMWYVIENDECACQGFLYRRQCRHITVVKQMRLQDIPKIMCARCGKLRVALGSDGICAVCMVAGAE